MRERERPEGGAIEGEERVVRCGGRAGQTVRGMRNESWWARERPGGETDRPLSSPYRGPYLAPYLAPYLGPYLAPYLTPYLAPYLVSLTTSSGNSSS